MAFWNRKRRTEATDQQLISSGAVGSLGSYGYDPIDGDRGFMPMGQGLRQVPYWTLEKSRAFSVAAYRTNPMGRAIIDTYTSFAVGDSGLTLAVTNPEVRVVAEEFWNDPANQLGDQDIMLRSHLLNGESAYEMMTGDATGVVRRSVIDPTRIAEVSLHKGNPLWPGSLHIRTPGTMAMDSQELQVIRIDDFTGLRTGEVIFWRSFRALETDLRGNPFLGPILDWLDNYDMVLSNLIDRTALARYLTYHYKFVGKKPDGSPYDKAAIDAWLKERGGNHIPRSGTIEATNEGVEITPLNAQSGAFEDTQTNSAVLTQIAAGSGLSKHWLAEPDQANRATSQSMAEPVRRRVGGVQNVWLSYQAELVRFAVDRAVAAGRIPAMVEIAAPGISPDTGTDGGEAPTMVPAAQTVSVTGPEVASADAKVVSEVMFNLAQSLTLFRQAGALTSEAAQLAAEKAWEQFTGLPFPSGMRATADDMNPDDLANAVNDAGGPAAGSPIAKLVSA